MLPAGPSQPILPPKTGRYSITADASVNYNNVPDSRHIGVQHKYGSKQWINVTNKSFHSRPHNSAGSSPHCHDHNSPAGDVYPDDPADTAETQVTQATQVTPVTQVTQATPAPQTTSTIPASQSDTTPPVTTLTLAGTEDGSGGYSSDVICTLTAADNPGGSGVSVTQYSFDGTSWNTYRQPFPLDKTGPMVLYYRSSDNAGNTEVANVKAIAISSPGLHRGTPANQAPGTAPQQRRPRMPSPSSRCRSGLSHSSSLSSLQRLAVPCTWNHSRRKKRRNKFFILLCPVTGRGKRFFIRQVRHSGQLDDYSLVFRSSYTRVNVTFSDTVFPTYNWPPFL